MGGATRRGYDGASTGTRSLTEPRQTRLLTSLDRTGILRASTERGYAEPTGKEVSDGASTGGEVIAFLIAWHVADELHVLNVATALHMRRRGVATAIMNEALAYARQSRVRIVLLEVRRSNRAAIRLYRTLGFSAMGLRPKSTPTTERTRWRWSSRWTQPPAPSSPGGTRSGSSRRVSTAGIRLRLR